LTGAYWPRPWTCEDGGNRRLGVPEGEAGPDIQPGEGLEVTAVKDAFATVMVIRREPGELYALRHDIPRGDPLVGECEGWVEKLDPKTLEVVASTPKLAAGKFWPGGIGVHANGDIYMVFGRWVHRLSPELEVVKSSRLPVSGPHNSFVILNGGELVMKDCDAPAGIEPSTFSVLDPETLMPVCPPVELPESSIARLSSDGENVFAVGTETIFRLHLDRERSEFVIDEEWKPKYGPAPGRSYGWDPVITDEHIFWMDNGRNSTDWSMRDTGDSPEPVRLWWARLDDAGDIRSVEISGLPFGTESNPPAWDPATGTVIAYDAGNAVIRAWRMVGDELEDLWRRDDFAHAGHLIVYPDTRELVTQDFRDVAFLRRPGIRKLIRPGMRAMGRLAFGRRSGLTVGQDQLVVLDLDTGEDKARVDVASPSQAFLFPAPGWDRDIYYQSITTITRVSVQ